MGSDNNPFCILLDSILLPGGRSDHGRCMDEDTSNHTMYHLPLLENLEEGDSLKAEQMTDLHPELQTWIDTATENLTESGRKRVVDEVLEGYFALGWKRARVEGFRRGGVIRGCDAIVGKSSFGCEEIRGDLSDQG